MKTTVDLSDELLRRAKRLALDRGTTLRELVESGLRRELAERERPVQPFKIEPWGEPGAASMPAEDIDAEVRRARGGRSFPEFDLDADA